MPVAAKFNGKESEAMYFEVRFDPVRQPPGFFRGQQSRHPLHDACVRIQTAERFAV